MQISFVTFPLAFACKSERKRPQTKWQQIDQETGASRGLRRKFCGFENASVSNRQRGLCRYRDGMSCNTSLIPHWLGSAPRRSSELIPRRPVQPLCEHGQPRDDIEFIIRSESLERRFFFLRPDLAPGLFAYRPSCLCGLWSRFSQQKASIDP